MSQKKLPEKINSLDIFSTGIELEPIYDDKTIINDYKNGNFYVILCLKFALKKSFT